MNDDTLSVLLVEDNPGDARLVREALSEVEDATITVVQASSIAEVRTRLSEAAFDIILLDPGLPDANGFEAVLQVQHAAPRLPILVLTGNDDDEFAIGALRAGAQDYVVKGDLDQASLMRTIRYVLGRYRSLSQRAELLSAFAFSLRAPIEDLQQAIEAMGDGEGDGGGMHRQLWTRVADAAQELRAFRDATIETARSESGALRPELRGLSAPALIAVIRSSSHNDSETVPHPDSRHLEVLLVEDNRGDARLVAEHLAESHKVEATLTHAVCVSEAVQRLAQKRFDVVLLDLGLPDALGLEAVTEVHHAAPNLAIVVLTGTDDDTVAVTALNRGAQDYLVKSRVDAEILARSLRYAVERQRAANLFGELLEGLSCELRRPLHVILGNLCLLNTTAAATEHAEALMKSAEAACALHRFSDDAIEAARSDKLRDAETGALAAIAELRRGASQRAAQAAEAATTLLKGAELIRGAAPEEPKASGLFGRFLQRVQAKKKKILVCDVDDDSRELARRVLETTAYEVVEATSTIDALDHLGREAIDLAIVQISSEASADVLAQQFRAAARHTGLVFTLNQPPENDPRRKPTEHLLLAKPFTPHQLLFAVAHLRETR